MDAVLSVTFLTASRLKLITTMTRLVLTCVCCLTRVGAQKKCIIIAPAVHLFAQVPTTHIPMRFEISQRQVVDITRRRAGNFAGSVCYLDEN